MDHSVWECHFSLPIHMVMVFSSLVPQRIMQCHQVLCQALLALFLRKLLPLLLSRNLRNSAQMRVRGASNQTTLPNHLNKMLLLVLLLLVRALVKIEMKLSMHK